MIKGLIKSWLFGDSKGLSEEVDNVANSVENLEKSGKGIEALGDKFTNLGVKIKSALSSLVTNPLTYFIAIFAGAAVAAYKHATAFDKAVEAASDSQKAYEDAAEELDSLNSELEANESKIKELDKLKNSGDISLAQAEELRQLQLQNAELERKIALQKELTDETSRTAVDDTMKALNVKSHQDLTQSHITYDKTGMVSHTQYKETDLITASRNEIDALRDLKEERNKLLEDDTDNTTQTDDFDRLDSDIKRYEESIKRKIESVNSLRNDFLDENGLLKEGLSPDEIESYEALTEILDDFNNIDLTPAQKELKKIENFFDGSFGKNKIKEHLLDSASSTEELEEELSNLGLTLDDLGIENIGFLYDYLNKTKEKAKEATDSIQDYAATVADIEAAAGTENQDKDWSTVSEKYKEAKELLKEGKTGTDDFQTMAKFLNPSKVKELAEKDGKYTADAYQKAFEAVKKTANRWFGEDETKSMERFVNDFKKKGLFDVKTDEMGLWDITTNFETTAEAADEFGMSIESVETMLESLGAYGYDFGNITFSGDAISEYESYLENIRSTVEELDDSDLKDRLNAVLADADTKDFENKIEELTPEIVADIKFEYDLAQIDLEIQKLRDKLSYTGYEDTSSNAELMASNDYRSETWRSENSGVKKDSGYMSLDDTISGLRQNFNGKSGEELASLQKQVMAVQEMRTAFETAFDIAELNGKKIDWESFINSDEANKTLSSIAQDFGLTESELEKVFGEDFELNIDTSKSEEEINNILNSYGERHIVMSIDATTEEIDKQIEELEKGQSVLFTAEVDGESMDVVAEKDLNGEITYKAMLDDGSVQMLNEVTDKEGNITFTTEGVDETTKDAEKVKKYTDKVPEDVLTKFDQNGAGKVMKEATDVRTSVNKIPFKKKIEFTTSGVKDTLDNLGKIWNKIVQIDNNDKVTATTRVGGGAGQYQGTAHAGGSAYANGVRNDIPIDAFSNDRYKTKNDDVALTGELGQELVVSGDRWWTVGDNGAEFAHIPADSIVFNHEQTKQLLRNGSINSRGKAHASGTAFLEGTAYRLGKKKKKTGNSDNNNKNKNKDKDKDSTKDSAEKIDWIERAIKKLERTIENFGKTADATWKKWSDANDKIIDRNDALTKSIEKSKDEITLQKKAAKRYYKEADDVGLENKYVKKIQNGTIDIQSIKSEKTRNKIQEYQEWYDKYLESLDKIDDLEADIAAKAKEKFENVAAEYEAKLSAKEHELDMIQGAIDNIEASGHIVTRNYYDQMIAAEEANKKMLQDEYDNLTTALSTAMEEGSIEQYSEDWYDMKSQIQEVEKAIQDANGSIIEFNNSILELEWERFERTQNEIAKVRDESDFLIDLMSDDRMFDKDTGAITNEGKATVGLHAFNYDVYKSQVQDYAAEIDKLNGLINSEEHPENATNTILLEQRDKLIEQQREMVEGMKDEEQAVKDLAEQGYDALLDVLNQSIDKRKEALSDMKSLGDYERDIADQTKNIASLEKRLAVSERDTSEAGKLNTQQLRNELDEAKKNLEQTEMEQYLSEQEQMLDKLSSDSEEFFNERLENIELLMSEAQEMANTNASEIKTTLEAETKAVGITLSDKMTSIWSPQGEFATVVSGVGTTVSTSLTTTNNTLDAIKTAVNKLCGVDEKGNPTGTEGTGVPVEPTQPTQEPVQQQIQEPKNEPVQQPIQESKEEKWGSWFKKKKYSGSNSKLNKNTSIVDRLKYFDFDSSFSARAKYFKAMKGSGTYKGTASQNTWMIKQMKKNGYAQGGTIGNLIRRTGEDGFVLAKSGETIITPETVSKLTEALKLAAPMVDYSPSLSKLTPMSRSISTTIDVGDIKMYGINDPKEFAVSLKHALQHDQAVKNIIQADTLGIMTGKNSLTKFKY